MAADSGKLTPRAVADGAALWHGRFRGGPSEALREFTVSIDVDRALWHHDLLGTRAHVEMLAARGMLDAPESDAILAALEQVREELASGAFVFEPGDEDIHTAIERRTTQLAPSAGAKIHTGRSRNDQVATALRLWCRDACDAIAGALVDLVGALSVAADALDDADPPVVIPGYTHLQRAQVILASHHLRAHCWALLRDVDRLRSVAVSVDVSPLGAGALGGSTLPIDPAMTAAALGFGSSFRNSMDAVSDRDFVADLLHACTMIGLHLSRIGEEWILWSSAEFGWVVLDDAYSTGSSMLPQKKNPDIAELARGKAGRLIGNQAGFLATLKGLPLAYNRDLQEDKEPIFDSVRQVMSALRATAGMITTARFDTERMAGAAGAPELAAIDLAEHLVREGTPFREAHAIVGDLVARSIETGAPLPHLAAESGRFGADVTAFFDPVAAVRRRISPGGGGTASALAQRTELGGILENLRREFNG